MASFSTDREIFPRALNIIRESTAGQKEDAELLFYLGMTQFRLGEHENAKLSLQRALELQSGSALAVEARKILAELK